MAFHLLNWTVSVYLGINLLIAVTVFTSWRLSGSRAARPSEALCQLLLIFVAGVPVVAFSLLLALLGLLISQSSSLEEGP
jgi:hypothetical protein